MTLVRAENAFTERPTNTAGVIGENVTLNCALSDRTSPLHWINPSGVSVFKKRLGITPGNEGQYMVDESEERYNLVVLNTEVNDAGQYECQCGSLTSSSSAFA